MTIPENTLVSWSHLGSVQQSASTYEVIKNTLESPNSPYAKRGYEIFLQGSYGNNTNIIADSDVDIVMCTNGIFYYDVDQLSPEKKKQFHTDFPNSGSFTYEQFKQEVVDWLKIRFNTDVSVGSKAIKIRGNGNRRDADVLVAANFRKYRDYGNILSNNHNLGIVFWKSDQTRIVNYPKQHKENCTVKNQATQGRFKPMVRTLKNMRNRMIDEGFLNDGVAPSYFLEGLLSNVPNNYFSPSLQDTFVDAINYIQSVSTNDLRCANKIHYLVRDNSEVCWPEVNFNTYIQSVCDFWNQF